MEKFTVEKTTFESIIYFENRGSKMEVCRVSQFSDCLEVYSNYKQNNASKALLLEIMFKKNRDTELTSHFVAGKIDTLRFNGITDLGELKVGKTPSKIKRLFTDGSKQYKEVFSTAKVNGLKVYFSVRFMSYEVLDEFENETTKESFLVGAYLYDPKSINDLVYEPLQTIYALRIDCDL